MALLPSKVQRRRISTLPTGSKRKRETLPTFEKSKSIASVAGAKPPAEVVARRKRNRDLDFNPGPSGTAVASRATPPPEPVVELKQVQLVLVQIWHRNKNQHRTQKWWKWVGLLRRAVRDLLKLELDGDGGGSGGGVKGGSGVPEAEKVRKRMARERERREEKGKVEEWIREVVVGRAWLAFSTLVSDTQFSTLGVVLLAIVAQVGRLVGLPEPSAPSPVPTIPEHQKPAKVLAASLRQNGDDRGEIVQRTYDSQDLDVGEVITRESICNRTSAKREDEKKYSKENKKKGKAAAADADAGRCTDMDTGHVVDIEMDETAGTHTAPLPESVTKAEKSTKKPTKRLGSDPVTKSSSVVVTAASTSASTPAGTKPKEEKKKKKKKRRKQGNAIDELFAGL